MHPDKRRALDEFTRKVNANDPAALDRMRGMVAAMSRGELLGESSEEAAREGKVVAE